jgi:hypothetical protein
MFTWGAPAAAAPPPGTASCRIRSGEGQNTPLELLLSFFGDKGSEVGTPADLSKLTSGAWTDNGKVLGVQYQGTDSSRLLRIGGIAEHSRWELWAHTHLSSSRTAARGAFVGDSGRRRNLRVSGDDVKALTHG